MSIMVLDLVVRLTVIPGRTRSDLVVIREVGETLGRTERGTRCEQDEPQKTTVHFPIMACLHHGHFDVYFLVFPKLQSRL